jgi:hypothetical protein
LPEEARMLKFRTFINPHNGFFVIDFKDDFGPISLEIMKQMKTGNRPNRL